MLFRSDLLVREMLPGATEETRRQLVERAGGNPLFLEEMVRMVESAEGDDIGPLPANVRSVISSRLDALDDGALHLIEDAAVLGIRGDLMALERMAEYQRSDADISESRHTLERLDLLETQASMWSFRSNLVREVVYSRLTKADRAWRHAGIASWIEANKQGGGSDTIAYHYRRAANHVAELGGVEGMPDELTEKAIEWSLVAARTMAGAGTTDGAERLFGEVLHLMHDDDPRKAEVLLERAASAMGRIDTSLVLRDLDAAAPLLDAVENPRLQVREALLRSELAQWSGDQDEALSLAEDALVLAIELGDPVLEADGLRRAGMVRLFRGEHDKAESSINAAYDAYAQAENRNGMAWARQNLAWLAFLEGRMSESERRLLQAVEAFEALGDLSGMAWSRGLLAYVRIHEGRFVEADELAQRTLIEARDRGDRWAQGMMHVALATSALWTGRVDEAIRKAKKARTMFPVGADPMGPSQAVAIEGRALVRSGRISEGFRLLTNALDAEADSTGLFMLEIALGAAAATVGDVGVGRSTLREIVGFDPDQIGESDKVVALSLVRLQSGDLSGASVLFDVMPETDSGEGSTWGWAVLALVAAAVDKDTDTYVSIVETSTRATYGDRVLARCAAACAAARAGDETGARVALDRAYEAIPLGGDRIHPTIVALAEAQCLAVLHADDAEAAEVRAVKTASALGLDTHGWRTAFAVACGELQPA